MRVLIVGVGYVGSRLGAELTRRAHEVFGLRRNAGTSEGFPILVGDITRRESLAHLPQHWDWVVNTASSSKGGAEEYRQVYLEGNRNLAETLENGKCIYTSSTSVYGQTDGSLVNEQSPTEPTSETSRILVEAEQSLLRNFPAVILRVAGIYGPGRGHLFQQFLKGEAVIPGNGERMINMIHVDDVVGAIIAALEHGKPGEVYNAADDEPVSYVEFFQWLSRRLNRPMPPFGDEKQRKRGTTNKRVSNAKLRALGYTFKYPNFRLGYEAEIAQLG